MKDLARITMDPNVTGGGPCFRGRRVTVGTIVGLMASGHSVEEILKAYPYLEGADISEALAHATWRSEEVDIPLFKESPHRHEPLTGLVPPLPRTWLGGSALVGSWRSGCYGSHYYGPGAC